MRVAVSLVALICAGCAATLDTADTVTTTVASPLGPEQAYRNIVTAMRRCYPGPAIKVEADYFPEAKAGSLRLKFGNDVGVVEYLRVETAPSETGGGTTVKGLHRRAQKLFPAALDAWSRGDSSECPYA